MVLGEVPEAALHRPFEEVDYLVTTETQVVRGLCRGAEPFAHGRLVGRRARVSLLHQLLSRLLSPQVVAGVVTQQTLRLPLGWSDVAERRQILSIPIDSGLF